MIRSLEKLKASTSTMTHSNLFDFLILNFSNLEESKDFEDKGLLDSMHSSRENLNIGLTK